MKSKRCALRFICWDQSVNYKTAYEDGEAQLLNISTSGCAFVLPTLPLSVGEKLLVSLELPDENTIFQAQGSVVRVENEGCVAISFTLVEPEDQALMRNYFSQLMRTTLQNSSKVKHTNSGNHYSGAKESR